MKGLLKFVGKDKGKRGQEVENKVRQMLAVNMILMNSLSKSFTMLKPTLPVSEISVHQVVLTLGWAHQNIIKS